MKVADFGVLHRNELSGALSGLTRVRRFQQDDAHIFCTLDQIGEEIADCFDFMNTVYADLFGFTYEVKLATRPDDSIGSDEVWERAEKQLKDTLEQMQLPYSLKEGDGAFYGPKIDIEIKDALGRAI
jgi:threonyl-tRNA synthetase